MTVCETTKMVLLHPPGTPHDALSPPVYDSFGNLVESNETARRISEIATGLARATVTSIDPGAVSTDLARLLPMIHDPAMLEYIEKMSTQCVGVDPAFATEFQPYGSDIPSTLDARTWPDAYDAAALSLSAAGMVGSGATNIAFALVRPPGHHAGRQFFAGYCFLNNAALAALYLLQVLGKKPAVLDVDYHAGDGTMDCLATFSDIGFASIHRSTLEAYPYCPELQPWHPGQWMFGLQGQINHAQYLSTLDSALDRLLGLHPDCLVVSIGFDIIEGDPHGGWTLLPGIFFDIGQRLAQTGLPLVIIQEGGYRIDKLAECAAELARGIQFDEERT